MSADRELVAEFVEEAREHLETIHDGLLRLETEAEDCEMVNAVFRALHTIKGVSAFVGLQDINQLSHAGENVLDRIRQQKLDPSRDVVDTLLEMCDVLSELVEQAAATGEDCGHRDQVRRLQEKLDDALGASRGGDTAAHPAVDQNPVADRNANRSSDPRRWDVFEQSVRSHVESARRQLAELGGASITPETAAGLQRELQAVSNSVVYMGREDLAAPCAEILRWIECQACSPESDRGVDSERLQQFDQMLAELLAAVGDERPEPSRLDADPSRQSQESRESAPSSSNGANSPKTASARTMRVDRKKLDQYINLTGELVIARNTLTHVFQQAQVSGRIDLRQLKAAIEGVDRITSAIQDNAMEMRMVAIKSVFQRFPRVIRDIAKAQGKQIDFQVVGEETEVDKQVAEALADPLIHLIRNSADHGIESPAERRAAGKPPAGQVTLKAGREGNWVVIDIVDDGRGVDVERLKAKALEKGVIDDRQAHTMSREEALDLVFAAGLSTAKEITDVSGRGVGMDVVRTNITELNGTIQMMSWEGKGTHLRIQLPLTLAVTTALLVEARGHCYAIPIEAVQETVKLAPEKIRRLKGEQAVSLRGRIVVLKSLGDLLGLPDDSMRRDEEETDPHAAKPLPLDHTGRVPVVVVDMGGRSCGIVVDRTLGQQEIVLKPLPDYLANLPGLGSATVMGDGTIVLILDPATLCNRASLSSSGSSIGYDEASSPVRPPTRERLLQTHS